MPGSLIVPLPEEQPHAFTVLPDAERAWRGRLFLMTWTVFGDPAYAWFAALAEEPGFVNAMRELVGRTEDSRIAAAFRAAWDERGAW